MLKLKNISKYYTYGKNKKVVLDKVSIDFKKRELVFILGPSGSGKSTLLNIIAGNLKCDSGEIFLDGEDICKFNERKLNDYRASMIGYIYQDYNLIEYLTVNDNITMGSKIDIKIVDTLLKQLGIYDKKQVVVSKLSGGEKQRVAIARAMLKNPGIILCDEPTGALDSDNRIKISEILKQISKNKLVIVVSHDEELAMKYADRIIRIKDGKVDYVQINDNEIIGNIKKSRIKKRTLIKLAFKHLKLKKKRTFLTTLAISLGIISMMMVVSLASNFNKEIMNLEKDVVSMFPISIVGGKSIIDDKKVTNSNDGIIIKRENDYFHTNKIDMEYLDYLKKIDNISYFRYNYDISMPFISDKYQKIKNEYLEAIPNYEYIYENYEIIYGNNIQKDSDILIKIDSNNNVSEELLNYFEIEDDIDYSEIVGRRVKVIENDLYYLDGGNYFYINQNNGKMYDQATLELEIVGIIKEKEIINDTSGLLYQDKIRSMLLEKNKNSKIVNRQIDINYNVLGYEIPKEEMLNYLGYNSLPSEIHLYVDSLSDKEQVKKMLDNYNERHKDNYLIYVDTMREAVDIVKEFVMIISCILVFFSVISLIISVIMVVILTNVRVLERKREIGILRGLGARKKDVVRLFNIENLMIGLLASVISLIILRMMVGPINSLMNKMLELDGIFKINYGLVLLVLLGNMFIIRIASSFPSRMASRMEITKCIYDK